MHRTIFQPEAWGIPKQKPAEQQAAGEKEIEGDAQARNTRNTRNHFSLCTFGIRNHTFFI